MKFVVKAMTAVAVLFLAIQAQNLRASETGNGPTPGWGNLPGGGTLPGGGNLPCIPWLQNCADPGNGNTDLPGKWTQSTFQNEAGSRGYYLYVPSKQEGHAIPLMVMLHGCFQNAPDFADQTGMNQVAEKYGFAVIYPEQTYQDNIWKCWNWFKPENQARNSGELSIVLGMIDEVSKTVSVDKSRMYVSGLSAGAAMAANLLACHSDIFAGAGIASGLEYKAATSEGEAHSVMTNGSTHDLKESAADAVKCTGAGAKMSAVFVIQGTQDGTVSPVNSARTVQQFIYMNDLLDDGQINGSQNQQPITSHSDQVPNGHSYTTDYFGGNGAIHVAKVAVEGMDHAWSGSAKPAQYMDQRGPDAAELMWVFLSNYGKHARH